MSEKSQFLEKLRVRKKAAGLQDQSFDEIRKSWIAEVGTLFDQLEAWLKPAAEEALLIVKRGEGPVEEEQLGLYIAPNLAVRLPTGEEVRIHPMARIVIGCQGRVDMVRGSGRRTLLLKESDWVILWSRSPMEHEPLTQSAFEKALQDLLPELA